MTEPKPAAGPLRAQIERFLTHLRGTRSFSAHTLRAYAEDLGSFEAMHPGVEPGRIERLHVRAYLAGLQQGKLARASVLRRMASLRSFVKWLRAGGVLKGNPVFGVPLPKRGRPLPKFLTESEMTEIFDAPVKAGDGAAARDRALLELIYSSGLRRSEAVSLNVGDIDFLSGTVRVFGKGSKERIVPVGTAALEALREFLGARKAVADSEPVFVNKRQERLSENGLAFVLDRWIRRTALSKRITPHVLRHSFATHMMNRGCDIRLVQELLGHASLQTTQIYTHVSLERMKEVYKDSHPRAASGERSQE